MARLHRRSLSTAVAVIASAMLLTGCFTFDATFTINDDATADLDYVIVFDTERLESLAEMFGEDTSELDGLGGDELLDQLNEGDDPCGELVAEFTDYDVSTREIEEDGRVGVGCTISGVPLAELSSLGDDTSSFSIEQDEDGTRFNAVLEGVDELTGGDAGADEFAALLDLDDLFTVRFVVAAPGSLTDNNATSTDGAAATWEITADAEFVVDGDATLTAAWTPGGGDSSGVSWWIALVVVGVIALVALVAIVLARRSRTGGTPNGTNAAAAVADGPPATASDGAPSVATPPPPPPPPLSEAPPSTNPPPPPASPTGGSSELPPPS